MRKDASALRWAAALGNADWCVVGPLVGALAVAWHTDVTAVTAGIAWYALGYGCALPLWGAAADRLGAGRTLRLGLLLATAASAASALCPGPAWWPVARLAAGVSFAAVTPCVSLFCESAATARERHRAFAGVTSLTAATAVATPVLAVLISRTGSWRLAFVMVAVVAAATAWRLSAGVVPRSSGAGPRPRPGGRAGGRGRPASGYWTVICVGVAEGATLLTLPVLLAPSLALSGERAAAWWAPALHAAGVWASMVLLRRHRGTWPPAGLLAFGGMIAMAGAGLAAAPHGSLTLLGSAVLLGAAWGCLHTTLQTWLPRLLPPAARARAASLFAASAMLASSAAIPISTSALSRGSRAAVFTCGALACAALTCLVVAVSRRWGGAPSSPAVLSN